ncbi:unnamed protein product, partial [Discosporangium mesarthrocarpum]
MIRGPGPDAVPSSAKRTCLALEALEELWRSGHSSSGFDPAGGCRGGVSTPAIAAQHNHHHQQQRRRQQRQQQHPGVAGGGFSDEDIEEVAQFLSGGRREVQLEDILAVFRHVRRSNRLAPAPPEESIPSLLFLGRLMRDKSLTAGQLVKEAAAEGGGKNPVKVVLSSSTRRSAMATTTQVQRYLRRGLGLTEAQRDKVLACVDPQGTGVVWGPSLASAVRRAYTITEHRRLEKLREQRATAAAAAAAAAATAAAAASYNNRPGQGLCPGYSTPPRHWPFPHRRGGGLGRPSSSAGLMSAKRYGLFMSQAAAAPGPNGRSSSPTLPKVAAGPRALRDKGTGHGEGVMTRDHHHFVQLQPQQQQLQACQDADSRSFNSEDASLLMELFTREGEDGVGRRGVTMHSALETWRRLKRQEAGPQGAAAGRAAALQLRRLLARKGTKPREWFEALLQQQ